MEPWKAPGIDGYQAGFYQTSWSIVGEDVCNTVINYFERGTIDKEFNRTIIHLIPKLETPTSITQFRPISLCTVIYKIVTKLIVNKLKIVIPSIVGPAQTSFVSGRHITENIIIAQEVIHTMRTKTGKTR